MEISVNELLQGRATRIKGKDYFSTEQYVTPFLERMSKFTNDFKIQVKLPEQYTLDKEINKEDITYNRVWIQAIMPEELSFPNHKESISLLYALDNRKPVVKIFRSGLNCACLNLCVFNPSFLNVQNLEPETAIDYRCINRLMEETSDICSWLHKLEDTEVSYDIPLIDENLGKWVRHIIDRTYNNGFSKVKLSTSTAIDAYKLLYLKEDSPYYVSEGSPTNMFNVYNAFTELISNDGTKEDRQGGDITNKAEKTLLLRDILQLV